MNKLIFTILLLFSSNVYASDIIKDYVKDHVSSWEATAISNSITKYSKQYELDPIIILAIIEVESSFRYNATSKTKSGSVRDYGLMQINNQVWIKDKHKNNIITKGIINIPSDLYNIDLNIKSGTFILDKTRSYCISWHKNKTLSKRNFSSIQHCMIASYNGSSKKERYYSKVINVIDNIRDKSMSKSLAMRFKKFIYVKH